MSDKYIRLSIPVTRVFNDRMNARFPKGVKAEVIRSLLEALMRDQKNDPYLVYDLLKENVKLVRIHDRKYEQEVKDEQET